jgi:hypothetical protein
LVFVLRQIIDQGSVYWNLAKDMLGVGVRSRVLPAAPGYFKILKPDNSNVTLVESANPVSTPLLLWHCCRVRG